MTERRCSTVRLTVGLERALACADATERLLLRRTTAALGLLPNV